MQEHLRSSQTLAESEIEPKKELEPEKLRDPYPCGAEASWEDVSNAVDAFKHHRIFLFPTITGFFLFSFHL